MSNVYFSQIRCCKAKLFLLSLLPSVGYLSSDYVSVPDVKDKADLSGTVASTYIWKGPNAFLRIEKCYRVFYLIQAKTRSSWKGTLKSLYGLLLEWL